MTEKQIEIILSELIKEREVLRDRDKILYNRISQCHNKLDRIKSEKVAPKILDPLVGKLIIIHEDDNFSVIKLDHWEIDKSTPSGINLFYTRMSYKRNNTFGSFRQRYYEDMFKYFIPTSRLSIIELFEGSEIQKKYPSMGME